MYDQSLYGKDYFEGGIPYTWERFQGFCQNIARHIARDFAPKSVLDIGCAKGFFVRAFREAGMDAWGFDASHYAIENADPHVKDFVWQSTIEDWSAGLAAIHPYNRDVVTCIEVLEHCRHDTCVAGIKTMGLVTSRVLFSSTPDDIACPTHINVQPPEYWIKLFEGAGFHLADYKPAYITPWAMCFEK